jgi:hypothetical protein
MSECFMFHYLPFIDSISFYGTIISKLIFCKRRVGDPHQFPLFGKMEG